MNKIKNDKIFKHHCSQQDSMHSNCRQDSPFPHTSKQNVYICISIAILNININISLYIAITGINTF